LLDFVIFFFIPIALGLDRLVTLLCPNCGVSIGVFFNPYFDVLIVLKYVSFSFSKTVMGVINYLFGELKHSLIFLSFSRYSLMFISF